MTTPPDLAATDVVLEQIKDERGRQLQKWGLQAHPKEWWYVILGEEFGEVGKAIFEFDARSPTWTLSSFHDLRNEVIQVAAVATAWAEQLNAIIKQLDEEQPIDSGN